MPLFILPWGKATTQRHRQKTPTKIWARSLFPHANGGNPFALVQISMDCIHP